MSLPSATNAAPVEVSRNTVTPLRDMVGNGLSLLFNVCRVVRVPASWFSAVLMSIRPWLSSCGASLLMTYSPVAWSRVR